MNLKNIFFTLGVMSIVGMMLLVIKTSQIAAKLPATTPSPIPSIKPVSTPIASASATPKVISTPAPTPTPSAASLYPNPKLTPGIFVNVPIDQLCLPGYVSSTKALTEKVKQQVFESYGLDYAKDSVAYEIDHLIPLELGGTNSIKNLWPQNKTTKPGFNEKNLLEKRLREKVCAGSLSIQKAQQQITSDWVTAYKGR